MKTILALMVVLLLAFIAEKNMFSLDPSNHDVLSWTADGGDQSIQVAFLDEGNSDFEDTGPLFHDVACVNIFTGNHAGHQYISCTTA